MNRLGAMLAVLSLVLLQARAEDYLKEAQQQYASNDSPLVKSSTDHRIKVTLLYIGPVSDAQIKKPFVLVYLREDLRTEDDLARHHATPTADGHFADAEYLLTTYQPEVKDGSGRRLTDAADERARSYKTALLPAFAKLYPGVSLPVPDHPDKADVFEYFYKSVATGPFDITLHDRIVGYGENSFRFRDIDSSSFGSR